MQSCKLLGQDRELNLWEPEHQSGVVIYQVSPRLEAMAAELAAHDGAVLEKCERLGEPRQSEEIG